MTERIVEVWVAGKASATFTPSPDPDVPWHRSPAAMKEHILDELHAFGRKLASDQGIEFTFTVDHVTTNEVK